MAEIPDDILVEMNCTSLNDTTVRVIDSGTFRIARHYDFVGGGDGQEDCDLCLNLCHPNYLGCSYIKKPDLRFHQWFNDGCFEKQKVYPSLEDYVTYLKQENVLPLSTYMVVNETAFYHYIPQEYIRLFRGMIDFIRYLHWLGYSLKQNELKADTHFAVVNKVLKFWNIDVKKASLTTRGRDFKLIAEVIRGVLGVAQPDAKGKQVQQDKKGKQAQQLKPEKDKKGKSKIPHEPEIPHDFANMLGQMDQYTEWGAEWDGFNLQKCTGHLIENHFAILSHGERVKFMSDTIYRFDLLEDILRPYYHEAVKNIGVENGWCNRFHKTFEPVAFEMVLKASACKPPNENPTAGVSTQNPRAVHKRPSYGTDDAVKYLSEEYDDKAGSTLYVHHRGFLRCCRNLAIHMAALRREVFGGESIQDKDIDLMLSQVFVKELVQFQYDLCDQGLLANFVV